MRLNVKHVEFTNPQLAQSLVDTIDGLMGMPLAVPGPLGGEALNWIHQVAGASARAPDHGVTVTWDRPLQHPNDASRWAVVVENEAHDLMPHLIINRSLVAPGRPLKIDDAVPRTADWLDPMLPPSPPTSPPVGSEPLAPLDLDP